MHKISEPTKFLTYYKGFYVLLGDINQAKHELYVYNKHNNTNEENIT